MEMTEYECKALKYVRDGKSLDAVPRGMTKAQFVTALRNLETYGMVRLALVEGGDIEAARLLSSGQAALDDMNDEELANTSTEIHFSKYEVKVLRYLGDGKSHSTPPAGMMMVEFKAVCNSLEEKELVDTAQTMDGFEVEITSDGLDALAVMKDRLADELDELQARLLELLSTVKPNETIEDIQMYHPFNMYALDELFDEFEPMREAGLILFAGTAPREKQEIPAFFKIMDKGRVALRKYKEKHPENQSDHPQTAEDQLIVTKLVAVMYNDSDAASRYLQKLRTCKSNQEVTKLTQDLVDRRVISDVSCKRPLWTILHDSKLYTASEDNWNRYVKPPRKG